MIAAHLRSLGTNQRTAVPATAPVRFVTEDGREFEFEFVSHYRTVPPHEKPTDTEAAKYTGSPTLVLVLREVKAVLVREPVV